MTATKCAPSENSHRLSNVWFRRLHPAPRVCFAQNLGLNTLEQVERFDALRGANDTAIADENGAPVRLIPNEVGPNGGPVGLNKNGDKGEVLPDDEEDGASWSLILLRSANTIAAQYDEFHEKVWWNRHQCWLDRLETGEETLTPQRRPIFDEAPPGQPHPRQTWRREPHHGRFRTRVRQRADGGACLGDGCRMG